MSAARLQITSEDRLRNIIRAYRAAQKDEKAVLPTYLSLLIEAAALSLADKDSAYANAAIYRDKAARHVGTAAHDRTTHGTKLTEGA